MKLWSYSLCLSITSFLSLVILVCLPPDYGIRWNDTWTGKGTVFPVLFLIWTLSLIAFAMNSIFADRSAPGNNTQFPALLKYLPSFLGIPVFLSFVWFVYTWLKGSAAI